MKVHVFRLQIPTLASRGRNADTAGRGTSRSGYAAFPKATVTLPGVQSTGRPHADPCPVRGGKTDEEDNDAGEEQACAALVAIASLSEQDHDVDVALL